MGDSSTQRVWEWEGVKSMGSECLYNNDDVLSPALDHVDRGVDATVGDSRDDASLHAVCWMMAGCWDSEDFFALATGLIFE